MADYKSVFAPNPTQKLFIESQAKADLFACRVGEGKSAALAWSVFYHTRHNPGATWAVIRDTWENLQRSTMEEFFKWFPPGVVGDWAAAKKEFTWFEGVAKGKVRFLGLDDPGDASKLMSQELAGIAMDEPAPAEGNAGIDELIFNIGFTRLRQTGIKWYSVKLAENNPDETHWTYKRFVVPGDPEFKIFQPPEPENTANLPGDFYAGIRRRFAHRPDLVRRFVEGKFGFQQVGIACTPEWDDGLHLAFGLYPFKQRELVLLWDFGLNPTCLVTQVTPMGHWNILDALVGDGIGVAELVEDSVKPLLATRYANCRWRHMGDPAGTQREQSSSRMSAVRHLTKSLGGPWKSGPKYWPERIEPLRKVLTQAKSGGRGLLQVDAERAEAVWHALRGGWHYHVARTGLVSGEATKNIHSHPGDALAYGAALLFPMVARTAQKAGREPPKPATFFGSAKGGLGFERPGLRLPGDGSTVKVGKLI